MLERNQAEMLGKIQAQMAQDGVDVLLLNTPDAIFYATGFSSQGLFCTNRLGGALAVIPGEGKASLVVSEFERGSAEASARNVEIVTYPVWIYIEDIPDDGKDKNVQPDPNQVYQKAAAVIMSVGRHERIAIQKSSMAYQRMDYLREAFPGMDFADADAVLTEAKTVKAPWEIQILRENTGLLEEIMYRTYRAVEPGMSEVDVFSLWNRTCFSMDDQIYDTTHTNMFGKYWSPNYVPDPDRRIETGDILRLDGVIWRQGYGSDIGRASAIGGKARSSEMDRIYEALYRGYGAMVGMIRPGVRMCDVYRETMDVIHNSGLPAYKRGHIGHSLGCNRYSEEYPFISAVETRTFQPGMVFCTELPYYSSAHHSYILEDTLCVREDGIELFSHVPRTLHWEK